MSKVLNLEIMISIILYYQIVNDSIILLTIVIFTFNL